MRVRVFVWICIRVYSVSISDYMFYLCECMYMYVGVYMCIRFLGVCVSVCPVSMQVSICIFVLLCVSVRGCMCISVM